MSDIMGLWHVAFDRLPKECHVLQTADKETHGIPQSLLSRLVYK